MSIENVDVIFGASWGDEGKGKISARIASQYDYVCRFNGGSNAGHTFYVGDKKVVTHIVPSGIAFGKPSIIGPNCVVCVEDFFSEVAELARLNFDVKLIKISPKAHIVQKKHKEQDITTYAATLGTTSKGIGPCYADKALRVGTRACEIIPEGYLWDEKLEGNVLCEGAQSFWLDINQGNYPYVTSSECLPYASCSLGFSPKKINQILAVAKMYDTRSGTDPYFDLDDEETKLVAKLGNEVGATTGRPRQVKWLNLDKLAHALDKAGATMLYLNKGDILEQANIFKLYFNSELVVFKTMDEMKSFIQEKITDIQIVWDFQP